MKHYKQLKIILASSSPYRLAQLQQHGFSAESFTPNVDESDQTDEEPRVRADRLAKAKAASVKKRVKHTENTLIVASDQVCHCNGDIYHKPGSMDSAADHLAHFSGQWVTFSTALSVVKWNKPPVHSVEDYRIKFRSLTSKDIQEYVALDKPYDCAGAVKLERFGLSLIEDADGRDQSSVIGLPMMALFDAMRALNLSINDYR